MTVTVDMVVMVVVPVVDMPASLYSIERPYLPSVHQIPRPSYITTC